MNRSEQPGGQHRLFVAIRLPDEVKVALAEAQRELWEGSPPVGVSWTRRENLHLTLRFLGNVAAARVEELGRRLGQAVTGCGEIELVCGRLGGFPDARFPRVVWAGVQDDGGRLAELHRRIEAAMAPFAEKPAEAGFVGHITLARVKRIRRPEAERLARRLAAAAGRRFGAWRCREVELIRSELTPGGSRYAVVNMIQLTG